MYIYTRHHNKQNANCKMMWLQTLLVFSLGIALSQATDKKVVTKKCPFGWNRFQNHCYFFCRTAVQQGVAALECKSRGGYLARVDCKAEDDFLKKQAVFIDCKTANYWISPVCKCTKKNYKCIWKHESNNQPLKYEGWKKDKKDIKNACAILDSKCGWKWDAVKCDSKAYYICEKPISKPVYASSKENKGKPPVYKKKSSSGESSSSSESGYKKKRPADYGKDKDYGTGKEYGKDKDYGTGKEYGKDKYYGKDKDYGKGKNYGSRSRSSGSGGKSDSKKKPGYNNDKLYGTKPKPYYGSRSKSSSSSSEEVVRPPGYIPNLKDIVPKY